MPIYTQHVSAGPRRIRKHSSQLALTGTTSPVTALGDASDSTYGKLASPSRPADYSGSMPTLGSGERIVSACPYARAKMPGTKKVSVTIGVIPPHPHDRSIHGGMKLTLKQAASAADYEIAAPSGQLVSPYEAKEWDAAQGKWTLSFRDPHTASANRAWWYEAGVKFYALEAATVATPSAPAGTVTTTQLPDLAATVSAIVESWQVPTDLDPFMTGGELYFAVYHSADVGTATAPPATVSPLFSTSELFDVAEYVDGTTPSTQEVTYACGIPLDNGDYVVFARAGRDHPNGVAHFSAWAHAHWTQAFPPPTALTLVEATADTPAQAVTITVTAVATTGYDSATAQVDVQRQVDGLWRNVRAMTGNPVAVGSAVLLGSDYECDRAVTNTYRARVSMLASATGLRGYSTWVQDAAAGPALTGTGWNLKTVEAPAESWLGARVLREPQESSQESVTVLEPLDRDLPVVLSGSIGGAGGSLEIVAATAAEIASAETLREYAGLVLLEAAFGDAKHIRVTALSWTRQGTSAAPRRRYTLAYAEVGSGLGTSA